MNEEERQTKQMKNEQGKRMVAYNAQMTDAVGYVWCMVVEDEAGYRPMTGSDPLQSAWYLSHFSDFTDKNGEVDYTAAMNRADDIADSWNWEQGYTPKEVMEIVASSMRAQFKKEVVA